MESIIINTTIKSNIIINREISLLVIISPPSSFIRFGDSMKKGRETSDYRTYPN